MLDRVHFGSNPWNKTLGNLLLAAIGRTDLNKGDLYPVVGLDIQHLNSVSCDRKSAVIFGDAPWDVDLISDAVLVLRSAPKMRYICNLHLEFSWRTHLVESCTAGLPGDRGTPENSKIWISIFTTIWVPYHWLWWWGGDQYCQGRIRQMHNC